jgi:hypothetical protein
MGLVGCGAAQPEVLPSAGGVPAIPSATTPATSAPDGGATAGPTAKRYGRPLPSEPKNEHPGRCEQKVTCEPEATDPPAEAYPAPFAKCTPESPSGGSFSVKESRRARIDDPKACCYIVSDCKRGVIQIQSVIGRPLRDGGEAVTAPVIDRAGWAEGACRGGATPAQRKTWERMAALEHASVASFAKLSLDLLALGAPSDLVALAHRAALDEIAHARLAFGLAGAPDRDRGPAPLALPAFEPPSLERLVAETLLDGCIGETIASVLAREAAAKCSRGAMKRALETIADDEARHAELAWRVLAWAASTDGERVLARALEARAAFDPGRADGPSTCGVLSVDEASAIRASVLREVIDPCLNALAKRT